MSGSIVRKRIYPGKEGNGSGGTASDVPFNGARAITRAIPSLQGVNTNTHTLVDFIEKAFFPAVAPACALSITNPLREVGQSTAYTLTWSVTKNTNNITGITVDGVTITPTGASQSGSMSGNLATASGSYSKSMSVTDGSQSASASVGVSYQYRRFWGTTTKNGTTQPILDSDILALPGSELATARQKTFTNFGGGNTRLIFAWPTAWGAPNFKINGLANTAFTKVRAASNFVNQYGATVQMDVWLSDNLYNSALDTVEIA